MSIWLTGSLCSISWRPRSLCWLKILWDLLRLLIFFNWWKGDDMQSLQILCLGYINTGSYQWWLKGLHVTGFQEWKASSVSCQYTFGLKIVLPDTSGKSSVSSLTIIFLCSCVFKNSSLIWRMVALKFKVSFLME